MTAATYEIVDTRHPHWQREAVRLAHAQVAFVVVGVESLLDRLFNDGLRVGYGLEVTCDENRVYFRPKMQAQNVVLPLAPSVGSDSHSYQSAG